MVVRIRSTGSSSGWSTVATGCLTGLGLPPDHGGGGQRAANQPRWNGDRRRDRRGLRRRRGRGEAVRTSRRRLGLRRWRSGIRRLPGAQLLRPGALGHQAGTVPRRSQVARRRLRRRRQDRPGHRLQRPGQRFDRRLALDGLDLHPTALGHPAGRLLGDAEVARRRLRRRRPHRPRQRLRRPRLRYRSTSTARRRTASPWSAGSRAGRLLGRAEVGRRRLRRRRHRTDLANVFEDDEQDVDRHPSLDGIQLRLPALGHRRSVSTPTQKWLAGHLLIPGPGPDALVNVFNDRG